LWEKADRIKQSFEKIANDLALGDSSVHFDNVVSYPAGTKIERIVLEEPLMGFRPGMSSAQTITQLMRFNGIVSYLAREAFHVEPEYVGSSHARKLCGIKLSQTKIGGPQKEQVFKHMAEHDLKHVHWPVKKNGATVDWSRDACDAYVIARAAMVNGGPFIVVKKPRKAKKSKDEE